MAANMDPGMQHFIQRETEKQKLQTPNFQDALHTLIDGNVLHELTEKCWDTCMDGVRPSTKLDSKTEGCFRNCVERFLDTNILVTNRLDKKADELLAKHDQLGQ